MASRKRAAKTANGDSNGDDNRHGHVDGQLVVEKRTGAHFVATTQDNGLIALAPVTLSTPEQYAEAYKDVE
jgi:hypothetical protein